MSDVLPRMAMIEPNEVKGWQDQSSIWSNGVSKIEHFMTVDHKMKF